MEITENGVTTCYKGSAMSGQQVLAILQQALKVKNPTEAVWFVGEIESLIKDNYLVEIWSESEEEEE